MPEEIEKAIREMPRDAEVIELPKTVSKRARSRRDNCNENPGSGPTFDRLTYLS
jgi:hypothetical protein